ncbi:DUF305 domain-containing protein [Amycolatopsis palatopharyngis]|uniref:DUF305 domain-containing protein n=1 Tax=Amycolatopsis palatopharyngis TaxID=187982 RepID=UPI0013BE9C9D|nr:DUF305 domain-containing protein [Amycolatopsis palatopharyngis]
MFDVASEHAQRLGRIAGWLELWNSPTNAKPALSLPGDGEADRASATVGEDDLAHLHTLSGPPFDLLLLRLLLRHHRGGLNLVDDLLERVDSGPVRALAGTIATSYQAETETLQAMITAHTRALRADPGPGSRAGAVPRFRVGQPGGRGRG